MSVIASKNGGDTPSGYAQSLKLSPDAYVSLGSLIDPTKPDNRDLLIQTFGDQGITGFLQLTGAVKNAGTADQVQYWENGRLHRSVAFTGLTAAAPGVLTLGSGANNPVVLRLNDVLLLPDGQRVVVTDQDHSNDAVEVRNLAGGSTAAITVAGNAVVIGNVHAQGTDQPSTFYDTPIVLRNNDYIITKETYEVNGSQATNIGWVDVTGSGDYRWYVKGEMDTRKRFMNQREMMMLFAQRVGSGGVALNADGEAGLGTITGSEGYFAAVEDRGITATGDFDSLQDIDNIILLLDKQGAPSEYAMYVNTQTSLHMDDMVASGIATSVTAGLPGQFGSFNNSPDLAVQLGFKSFTRGGYTFHKHDWKLLNDPTLLGAFSTPLFKGAMVPLSNVADAKTGEKAPALEMNYKAVNGYSREMEHWVTGGGVLGFNTDGTDTAKFHYRSECNLVTRAANQHVVLKS
tara:strand:+ start:4575 stop:5954 length:1380 start_codon:yes stop_codon:yes gene_type:complete